MFRLSFFEALIFIPILLWPLTQIILALLIAISYVFRKHFIAKYCLYFLIVVSIAFSFLTLYFFAKNWI